MWQTLWNSFCFSFTNLNCKCSSNRYELQIECFQPRMASAFLYMKLQKTKHVENNIFSKLFSAKWLAERNFVLIENIGKCSIGGRWGRNGEQVDVSIPMKKLLKEKISRQIVSYLRFLLWGRHNSISFKWAWAVGSVSIAKLQSSLSLKPVIQLGSNKYFWQISIRYSNIVAGVLHVPN